MPYFKSVWFASERTKKYKVLKATIWLNEISQRDIVSRWFKPLSHDRDLPCHWEWKKKQPSVWLTQWMLLLPLTVNLSLTEMLRNQPQLHTDPPHPFITRPSIYPSILQRFQMFVYSLSPSISLHPSPLWSPQKRLIQEGWAGVSELLLLCPMRCFHSIFLLLCCLDGPNMLTVQVAESQTSQPHKGCLFTSKNICSISIYIVIHVQIFAPNIGSLFTTCWQITAASIGFLVFLTYLSHDWSNNEVLG